MTLTDLIMDSRGGKPLTPYQEWCLGEIEKSKNYEIVVGQDGTRTVYGKKNSKISGN